MPDDGDAVSYDALGEALSLHGFIARGGFHPEPEDAVPALSDGRAVRTVVLAGSVGPALWQRLREAPEAQGPDPIDRYTARTIQQLAHGMDCTALFPFGGPPWHPFQRWAMRAEPGLATSPLGILIHPTYGLWHAYRAALLFARTLPLPAIEPLANPCATCATRPCLSACPVAAISETGYDIPACRAHLRASPEAPCLSRGCLARLACPVGRVWAHLPEQAAHHMRKFIRG